jgi:NhaA family Na+:H+ antiporter
MVPAGIFLLLNYVITKQTGIPMATDICNRYFVALGNRVPTSLKYFLTALAVIDDIMLY